MRTQFSVHKIDGHDLVSVWASVYPVSISVQMTADDARELADKLIDAAREVEQREEATSVIIDLHDQVRERDDEIERLRNELQDRTSRFKAMNNL